MSTRYVAVADMEYSGGRPNEVCDFGIVICKQNWGSSRVGGIEYLDVVESFGTIVNIDGPVFYKVKQMTGITAALCRSSGAELMEVLSRISELFEKYDVHKTYTWGNDKTAIEGCLRSSGVAQKSFKRFTGTLVNREPHIRRFTPERMPISLENAKTIFGLGEKVSHRAINDALDVVSVNNRFTTCFDEFQDRFEQYAEYVDRRSELLELKNRLLSGGNKEAYADVFDIDDPLCKYKVTFGEFLKMKGNVIR